MGLRVRKSIKVAPGVKVNVGKKSVGVSVGGKNGGVSVNSKKGVTTRVSAPGTGLSYTEHIPSNKSNSGNSQNANQKKASSSALRIVSIILIIVAIACVCTGLYISDLVSPTLLYIIGGICGILGVIYFLRSFKKSH